MGWFGEHVFGGLRPRHTFRRSWAQHAHCGWTGVCVGPDSPTTPDAVCHAPVFGGVGLLIAVALFGITKKGATRWVNVGIVIQPSEIMKIAMPLLLALWVSTARRPIAWHRLCRGWHFVAGALCQILRQPDLGTALLVLASGLFVIFAGSETGGSSCHQCCWV